MRKNVLEDKEKERDKELMNFSPITKHFLKNFA